MSLFRPAVGVMALAMMSACLPNDDTMPVPNAERADVGVFSAESGCGDAPAQIFDRSIEIAKLVRQNNLMEQSDDLATMGIHLTPANGGAGFELILGNDAESKHLVIVPASIGFEGLNVLAFSPVMMGDVGNQYDISERSGMRVVSPSDDATGHAWIGKSDLATNTPIAFRNKCLNEDGEVIHDVDEAKNELLGAVDETLAILNTYISENGLQTDPELSIGYGYEDIPTELSSGIVGVPECKQAVRDIVKKTVSLLKLAHREGAIDTYRLNYDNISIMFSPDSGSVNFNNSPADFDPISDRFSINIGGVFDRNITIATSREIPNDDPDSLSSTKYLQSWLTVRDGLVLLGNADYNANRIPETTDVCDGNFTNTDQSVQTTLANMLEEVNNVYDQTAEKLKSIRSFEYYRFEDSMDGGMIAIDNFMLELLGQTRISYDERWSDRTTNRLGERNYFVIYYPGTRDVMCQFGDGDDDSIGSVARLLNSPSSLYEGSIELTISFGEGNNTASFKDIRRDDGSAGFVKGDRNGKSPIQIYGSCGFNPDLNPDREN